MLDDKDIDAVVIATPNHWHALATIWALQAGKHVYVEKPSSHTVWEGRKMVEAAARYNKIVQVGTMNRSRPAVREAIKFIHDGGIGKVYMARGLCFKPRPSIGKYPDGPMAPGEKYALTVDVDVVRADLRRSRTCRRSTTTCGSGRRRSGRSTAIASTTTGTGTGTTATATPATRGRTSSTSRAGGCSKQEHPVKVSSVGGYFGAESSQETPDTQTTLFEYADGTILEFAHARRVHQRRRHADDRQPVLRPEGLAVDRRRRPHVAVVHRARRTRRARARTRRPAAAAASRWARRASSRRTTRTSSTRSAPTIRSC